MDYRRSGNFRRSPTMTEIKNFQHRIIRTKLHFRYAEATKIIQRENLTDEYFYERKYPDLWYYNAGTLQLLCQGSSSSLAV